MIHKTSKFITILIAYVYFFFPFLNLNATINNNVLSIIQADRSFDYYTWNELENYKKHDELIDSFIIKKIIVNEWDLNKLNSNSSNFLISSIRGLVNLNKNKCKNINVENKNLQAFEISFMQAFNAWQVMCKNKKSTKKSKLYFDENLDRINPGFSNFIDFNKLSYLYLNEQKEEFINLYSKINFDNSQFISINFRKIFFLKKMLKEFNIENNNLNSFINKFYTSLGDELLGEQYQIKNYKDLVFEQAFQLSDYYMTLGRYEESLTLLSVLNQIDQNNKDYYVINKLKIMLSLNKSQRVFNQLSKFDSQVDILNFLKHKLYLEHASSFKLNKDDIINYFELLDDDLDSNLRLNLAFEVLNYLYNSEGLDQSIVFLEKCCLQTINESRSEEFIFRYGALLEQSERIPEAEKFILKSIEYSGDNPSPIILNYLAYLWIEMDKNFDIAEDMLVKAISETEAKNGAILDSLGWLYFKKNNFEIAEKWIHDAYILEPAEPEIIDHLAQVYRKLGRNKEARYLDFKILNFHKDYFKFEQILNRNNEK